MLAGGHDTRRSVAERVEHGRGGVGEVGPRGGQKCVVLLDYAEMGRLPVVNFAAGGVATPADAALMMQLGVDGVFVGVTKGDELVRLVEVGEVEPADPANGS